MIDGRLHLRPTGAVAHPQTTPPPQSARPRDLATTDKPSFFDRLPRLWPKRNAADEAQTAAAPPQTATAPPQTVASPPRMTAAPPRTVASLPQTAAAAPATDQASDTVEKKSLLDRLPKLRAPKWMAFGRSDTEVNR
jgi:hypothetical protein